MNLDLTVENQRWTECDWLDGPKFVHWCRMMGFIPPEHDPAMTSNGERRQIDPNLARRIWDWAQNGRSVTIWSADKVMTESGGHISMIPDEVWRDKPVRKYPLVLSDDQKYEAIRRVVVKREKVSVVADSYGVHRRTVANWAKSASLRAKALDAVQ